MPYNIMIPSIIILQADCRNVEAISRLTNPALLGVHIMSLYQIKKYENSNFNEWDSFIKDTAVNGTFLQSRNFLSYHPKDRFIDCSLMVYDEKNHLVAVVPACEKENDNKKIFSSHTGSTFGGPIISKKYYNLQKTTEILESIENYLKENGFDMIDYKITPSVFSKECSDLLEYALYYEKYSSISALSLVIDYAHYNDNVYSNLSQGKRTDVNNCKKAGMYCRKLESDEEIKTMYDILCKTLEKYEATPVHTVDELLDFKNNRLKDNTGFFGIFVSSDKENMTQSANDEMVAGSMMFYFGNDTAHTQYLCANPEYNRLSPMSFLYYSMLEEMKALGFKKLSWGGTTEEDGTVINMGLAKSKEAYGSSYYINYSFRKNI